ncbi:MAG: ABC transporter ATP-binding protein [Oscillospiraceae bacterium]|nr:ABC transporter ATP-binding protein [Oscillospiraceae bacterium]
MKKYQKRNSRYFIEALVCIFIGTVFSVTLQFFKGDVLDYAISGEIQKTVYYAVMLFGFILCEIFFYYLYDRFSSDFVAACTGELKKDIFTSIIRKSYVEYKKHPQGEYIAKYTNEADMIKERRFRMLPMFWEILFKIIFVSAALFVLDWRIAIITIALLTTPLYIPKLIEKSLQNEQQAHIQAVENNLAKVNDWLSGFEIIKNYSVEHKIIEKFKKVNDTAMEKMLKDMQLGNLSGLITTLISYLSYFVVLICATWLVLKGDFSAGDFFVAIGMIDQLSYPLISLAGITRQLIAIKPACSEMEEFLKNCEETKKESSQKNFCKDIRFDDVSFTYDNQRFILEKFNLIAEKGKRYLLKGPSGCGKTTAINLLLKYYAVTDGDIKIDGIPLETIDSTYGIMTVVRQEAILFNDTLRNNLTMYQEVPECRLFEVLKSVGLERYACTNALDRVITESGSNFSGGERKRICLARALLRDTDVLILDEPLANLDPSTAERIEDLILSIKNKTILVVSHQFTEEKLDSFDKVIDFTER